MGLSELKKELKKLDKDKLIELVVELYRKNKSVKEYFDFYLNPDDRELFFKYKDKIFYSFYPERGNTLKLKDAKQALSDFKKLGSSNELVADLMLFYVETGVSFTNDFGDVNEAFYNSLASTYLNSLTLMRKENYLDKFQKRVENIVSDTKDIGWGFHDFLFQTWMDFYPSEDEDEEIIDKETKGKIINLNR
ncbi:MAG: hypothetical protein IPP15_00845 [Saprospiraceae bacterium]|uniref:Uncharacterized protein n=1 Tax=Candidatus Opimibacter skivensis TaxID=2982028 RepID=A0A9D7XNF9_9BACT|nr:hypothetical protein [Candidatus Opimibacter skivensis]